ncbi:MAG: hypothetical protein AB4062_04215 [Crocosphaera sp.]
MSNNPNQPNSNNNPSGNPTDLPGTVQSPNLNQPNLNQPQANQNLIIPHPSREAEDYALSLAGQLSQRNLNIERLEIKVDDKSVFKMRDGDLDKSTINNEQAELIKKALKDPAALKGTVKITQGSQVLLHVKNGRVLVDKARLTEQSAQVEVTSQKGLYDKYSQNVNSQGLQKTKEVSHNALKDGMDKKDVVDLLQNHDAGYSNLVQQSGQEQANNDLNKMVDLEAAKLKANHQQSSHQQQQLTTSKAVSP